MTKNSCAQIKFHCFVHDVMYELPSQKNVKKFEVTRDYAENRLGHAKIVKRLKAA